MIASGASGSMARRSWTLFVPAAFPATEVAFAQCPRQGQVYVHTLVLPFLLLLLHGHGCY